MNDDRLTERQRQVLAMRKDGKSNREIALALGCSTQNVWKMFKRIKERRAA